MNVTRLAAVNCRDPKISSGNIGCRTLRSATTKPASDARPTALADSTRAVAPRSPPSISAQVTPAKPTAVNVAPTMSRPRSAERSRVSGTCRSDTATTAIARGTLIRKISRHEPAPMSHPPKKGAMAPATPDRPDHAPTARPRSRAANERARGHQRLGRGCDAAEQRCSREPEDSEHKNPPTPESITQGTAKKNQRRERERVGIDDPLQPGDARVQLSADRRQCDVHHRGVQKCEARYQYGGQQNPTRPPCPPVDGFVYGTRCGHDSTRSAA